MKLIITVIIGLTLGILLVEYDIYLKIQDHVYYDYYTYQDNPPPNLFTNFFKLPPVPRLPKIADLKKVFDEEGIDYIEADLTAMGYNEESVVNDNVSYNSLEGTTSSF